MAGTDDPALRVLEKALEVERQRSRDADAQLRDASARELSIAREILPTQAPPSASAAIPTSGWTVDTAMAHLLALRQSDREFYAERQRSTEKFEQERDRRLTEVAVEREKALKIKETADLAALQLAREIQTYKDEKANELREQISAERGLYVTVDKYEDRIKGESDARTAALSRVDEKFVEYLKRWEQRQREVDQAIAQQKSNADQKNAVLEAASADAQKIAEDRGRRAILAAQELARKTNRNMGLFVIAVTIVVAIANGAGPF